MYLGTQFGPVAANLVDVVLGPIETRMIEEAPDTDEPPPPPPPKIETPPPFVPPPEVAIEMPVEAHTATAIRKPLPTASRRRRRRRFSRPPPVPTHGAQVRSAPAADAA